MAYDWSGNNIKQQRYDRVVLAALLALALFVTITPLALFMSTAQPGLIKTTAVNIKAPNLKM
jgi:hypothetical protein